MKTKKNDFIFSHYILIFIIIIIALYVQIILIQNSNFLFANVVFYILPIGVIALVGYAIFSKPLFANLFQSQTNLDNKIKKTLHELNTPVATILINIKMLKKAINDDKNSQRLDRIQDACNDLLELYEDMEYSIKKEIERVDKDDFMLKDSILEIISKHQELLEQAKINATLDLENLKIKTDKKGFYTAISNIISNAIKYNTTDGYIDIYLKDKILHIKNSGTGIDTKNLFLVFDSFYQENRSISGYGMGLAIVKDFCDANDITININSKENNYTIVSLDIRQIIV